MNQVYWNVFGRIQEKFEDHRRRGVGKAKVSDETSLQMPTGVHAARTIQCRLLQSRWNWQKVKNLVGSRREMMQKQDRCPGGEAFHALPGGHSDACRARFERTWADDESIEAAAEAERMRGKQSRVQRRR